MNLKIIHRLSSIEIHVTIKLSYVLLLMLIAIFALSTEYLIVSWYIIFWILSYR